MRTTLNESIHKYTEKILKIVLVILIGLFCFSLFKNIQYPLLWNDEAVTVMYAKSILKYGYPRIIFEGNFITQLSKIKLENLANTKSGAAIENGWLASYIAAPFVAIGESTNNIYLKTTLARLPSVILGIIGILLFGYITTLFVNKKTNKLSVFILFMFIVLYNTPLALHLREARYYSLLLFLLGIYWLILLQFNIFTNLQYKYFAFSMPIISLTVLLTYPPAFVPCLVVLYVVSVLYNGRLHVPSVTSFSPALITTLLSVPILRFFDVLTLSQLSAKNYNLTFPKILSHIYQIIVYLYTDELLISSIIIAIILFIIISKQKNKLQMSSYFQFLFFAIIFSVSYIAVLSRLPYLFTRYYIYLGPLVSIVSVVGLISSTSLSLPPPKTRLWKRNYLFILFSIIFIYNFAIHNGYEKARRFNGHIYEMTQRYVGPLDVIIPYILSHTTHPEKLVIATNYEEFSYMYYLGSRVTIGYVNINLEEDLKIQPDIIIFRPGWGSDPKYFNDFLKKDKYNEITFPVVNYPLNNIPEFYFQYPHQFKTLSSSNKEEQLAIFVRENSPVNISN